ncbi:MAG TPA: hypothetical protein VD887_10475 [Allosphingosinicella sp.]|nr:hypothetical protein [Allosphingosinicella sp.]
MQRLIDRAAAFARLTAAGVSFLYMSILLPHLLGVQAESLSSPWFWAALCIAFSWIPLLIVNPRIAGNGSLLVLGLSVAPLFLIAAFFTVLLANG